MHKADSSPLPEKRRSSVLAEDAVSVSPGGDGMVANVYGVANQRLATAVRRASQPAPSTAARNSAPGSSSLDEFPYSSAFAYSLSNASPFPCGSEAVMINSALAHDAFQEMQNVSATAFASERGAIPTRMHA